MKKLDKPKRKGFSGKSPRQRGKSFELQVAHKIKGQRAGYGNASTQPDVFNEWLEIEAKVDSLPEKMEQALKVVKSRGDDKKLQMVVMKKKGAKWEDARCYMSFTDFLEWHG